mmetsp:Transcript_18868/g.34001  ORF Transcript_18868/g.34001 Transcript_18868/m.34001 type:complete len:100 (+) Transcript_18868:421-720(+)|eukprot:CAMPEP_0201622352 /NCGR_PEP_ID=MMETSP0492-20130828/47361_1 /ASSEMBLY_ACC=CAM_ASM_000837 /TAXON_ID=420259 /ORGANISM="Thalassiosira gravida, Strain GMp14c1" /LENGTH=99 /DNA_ID=CAMNT_0048091937 /DNA_START=947 /DNA_END=1246 /DNA_ORIENTATION=+
MTVTSSSSSPTPNNSTEAVAAASPPQSSSSPTALQLALGAIILGTSAGLTFYTKRTGTMMNQLERASKNATVRRGPQKDGPKTKLEYEKTKNRWEKDDL